MARMDSLDQLRQEKVNPPPAQQLIKVDATENCGEHYWQAGIDPDAPLLFAIHGFPDSPKTWFPLLQELNYSGSICLPSLFDSSQESSPHRLHGMDSVTLNWLSLLKKYDPRHKKKIIIICHDIAGPLGWHFADILKDRLASMICINGPSSRLMKHRLTNHHQVLKSWYIALFQIPYVSQHLYLSLGYRAVDHQRKKENLPLSESLSSSTTAQFMTYYRTFIKSLWDRSHKIASPVLYIAGSADPYLLPATEDELSEDATQFELRVVEGGHWPHESQPKVVTKLIYQFLRKNNVYGS